MQVAMRKPKNLMDYVGLLGKIGLPVREEDMITPCKYDIRELMSRYRPEQEHSLVEPTDGAMGEEFW